MPTVKFEGKLHKFPEGTTPEQISAALTAQGTPVIEQEDEREPFAEEEVIKKDEGVKRDKAGAHISYMDRKGKAGKLTGGRGHLLTKEEQKLYPKGTVIPDKLTKQWFKQDMKEADDILTGILEEKAVYVPDEVYSILLNMTFNLGEEGLLGFNNMWAAIQDGNWKAASKHMLVNAKGNKPSRWLTQVGKRANRLSDRMAAVPSNVQEEKEAKQASTSSTKSLQEQAQAQGVDLGTFSDGTYEDANGNVVVIKDGKVQP